MRGEKANASRCACAYQPIRLRRRQIRTDFLYGSKTGDGVDNSVTAQTASRASASGLSYDATSIDDLKVLQCDNVTCAGNTSVVVDHVQSHLISPHLFRWPQAAIPALVTGMAPMTTSSSRGLWRK